MPDRRPSQFTARTHSSHLTARPSGIAAAHAIVTDAGSGIGEGGLLSECLTHLSAPLVDEGTHVGGAVCQHFSCISALALSCMNTHPRPHALTHTH